MESLDTVNVNTFIGLHGRLVKLTVNKFQHIDVVGYDNMGLDGDSMGSNTLMQSRSKEIEVPSSPTEYEDLITKTNESRTLLCPYLGVGSVTWFDISGRILKRNQNTFKVKYKENIGSNLYGCAVAESGKYLISQVPKITAIQYSDLSLEEITALNE